MELRDLAERIVRTTVLAEKVSCPDLAPDEPPGLALAVAPAPGRTPSVFVFNPFAEGRIAQGRSFTPTGPQAALALDLANLPQYLGRQDDLVLVPRRPSAEFLHQLQLAGFALPEFVELKDLAGLADRTLGALRPWAWGPDSLELLAPLLPSVTRESRTAQRFNDGIAQLYSKAWSAELLGTFLRQQPPAPWLATAAEVGVAVNTLEEAQAAIARIRARGHHRVVVKQALGLAGHNAIRLWEPDLTEPQRRWMARALHRPSLLIVEPWLERLMDFSVQLEMAPDGLRCCGYTGLINDVRGQYTANWAAPDWPRQIPSQILTLFPGPRDLLPRLQQSYADLFALLESRLRQADYLGPVGVDACVYRPASGGPRLKPVVEINPRHTMGRLLLELMRQICPGSYGLVRLVRLPTARAQGYADLAACAAALRARHPLGLEGEPAPKIREGLVCLNDPVRACCCLAVLQAGHTLDPALLSA